MPARLRSAGIAFQWPRGVRTTSAGKPGRPIPAGGSDGRGLVGSKVGPEWLLTLRARCARGMRGSMLPRTRRGGTGRALHDHGVRVHGLDEGSLPWSGSRRWNGSPPGRSPAGQPWFAPDPRGVPPPYRTAGSSQHELQLSGRAHRLHTRGRCSPVRTGSPRLPWTIPTRGMPGIIDGKVGRSWR